MIQRWSAKTFCNLIMIFKAIKNLFKFLHSGTRLLPIISWLFTSCVSYPISTLGETPKYPRWKQHVDQLYKLSHYTIYGSVTYTASILKFNTQFFFQKIGKGCYRLLITRPFGSTELLLKVKGKIVEVVDNQGRIYPSEDADIILNRFHIVLPLVKLPHWIIGLPEDNANYQLNNRGQLSQINDDYGKKKWIVSYSYYNDRMQPYLPFYIKISDSKHCTEIKISKWIIQ